MRGERCGLADRRAWGGGPSGTCVGRTRLKVGVSSTRGAHPKHTIHVRDLGRVEAQWLIERTRVLPSYKGGICEARGEVRTCRQAGMGRRPKRHILGVGPPTKGWVKVGDPQVCAERTSNMLSMVVTLDVSKLSG